MAALHEAVDVGRHPVVPQAEPATAMSATVGVPAAVVPQEIGAWHTRVGDRSGRYSYPSVPEFACTRRAGQGETS